MKRTSAVLVVMSAVQPLSRLLTELGTLATEVIVVHDCRAARELLSSHPGIDVVVTDQSLVDGNWCNILTWIVDQVLDTRIVVSSPLANENLWSEVLWRGGFDILAEPYQEGEVRRVVESALRGLQTAGLGAERELAGAIA
jgi:DNA-binding NtrC family response regulator